MTRCRVKLPGSAWPDDACVSGFVLATRSPKGFKQGILWSYVNKKRYSNCSAGKGLREARVEAAGE